MKNVKCNDIPLLDPSSFAMNFKMVQMSVNYFVPPHFTATLKRF